ncbi:GNT-I family protein [Onchocerca flexuosa]|uniref:Alpha-1,3-mannosyl-glycoprotein 2-beta-N-acetylglucosaminyltransferase n=1 Tax=Onchocerca flexuosa TaxID=387005 RepID=A0A238BPE0_9BILA|nr:GNT-I family protein [Onchocerca flexuosa]
MGKEEFKLLQHLSSQKAHIRVIPEHKRYITYYQIARHYKLGLSHVFDKLNHSSVIIIEDDLDIAPDFFEYFSATRPLLDIDKTLYCVSAWNDNGKNYLIDRKQPELLYRSDFFPGLGWMMTKNSLHYRGLFFTEHLTNIVINEVFVNFTNFNLRYLLQENYDSAFLKRVYSAPLISLTELATFGNDTVRIQYKTLISYLRIANQLKIMRDFKDGVPRTAYLGVVTCFINGTRIYIAPDRSSWSGYDPKWEAP